MVLIYFSFLNQVNRVADLRQQIELEEAAHEGNNFLSDYIFLKEFRRTSPSNLNPSKKERVRKKIIKPLALNEFM